MLSICAVPSVTPAAIRPPDRSSVFVELTTPQGKIVSILLTDVVRIIEEAEAVSPPMQRQCLSKVRRASDAGCSSAKSDQNAGNDKHGYILRCSLQHNGEYGDHCL